MERNLQQELMKSQLGESKQKKTVHHPRTGIRGHSSDQEAIENDQKERIFPWNGKFCNTLPQVAQIPKTVQFKSDEGIGEKCRDK